ncbi:MAG TPA: FtsX-like permease family protein, partial [Vicinamibacterales bacterium]
MRERVAEGLALAAPGALLGVALAYAGAAAFTRAIAASSPPYWVSVVIDARVLAYAAAITVLSALAASALPSWRSGSAALSAALSDEARGATSGSLRRTTAVLIIVEVGLAVSVLIAAGLMATGIAKLADAEYDFAVEDVTAGRVSLPARAYPDAMRRREFFRALHARLQEAPGVTAALGTTMPFAAAPTTAFALGPSQGAPEEQWPETQIVAVSPGYFAALGVSPLGGRDFEIADGPDRAPVAIVNLSFALEHARREDLIGRTIQLGTPELPPATIVGIVPDLAVGNARGEQPEAVYVPLFQQTPFVGDGITVIARGRSAAGDVERALRAAVSAVDPALPLDRVTTLAKFRESVTWFYRVFGFLFLAFGLGALVLALVGVYAVMSFGVTRRRREIGTRMAFGATRGDIARMFLAEGAVRLAAGLAGGALLAAWLTPRLAMFFFRVSPRDPAVFAAAVGIVAAVGLAACAVPAWRAARQEPNACLREP